MGNPFVHIDLTTGDVSAAKKFYRRVFDWKFVDHPEMKWTGLDVGKGVGGGLSGKQSAKQPTAWTPYVEVKDVKKALAKAKAAGAKITVPFMPIPDMGALGVFVDPQGATIGVWAPAPKRAAKKPAARKTAVAKKTAPAKRATPAKKPARKAR